MVQMNKSLHYFVKFKGRFVEIPMLANNKVDNVARPKSLKKQQYP